MDTSFIDRITPVDTRVCYDEEDPFGPFDLEQDIGWVGTSRPQFRAFAGPFAGGVRLGRPNETELLEEPIMPAEEVLESFVSDRMERFRASAKRWGKLALGLGFIYGTALLADMYGDHHRR